MITTLALVLACTGPGPGFAPGTTSSTTSTTSTTTGTTGTTGTTTGWTATWEEPNVASSDDLGRAWTCVDPFVDCVEDYLSIPARFPSEARPTTEAELEGLIEDIVAGRVNVAEDVGESLLAAEIRTGINGDFLQEGLNARQLDAVRTRSTYVEGTHSFDGESYDTAWTEERYLLVDPIVGEIEVYLWYPSDHDFITQRKAIILTHGHGQRAESMVSYMYGWRFIEEGYIVAAATYRASGADDWESLVTQELLLEGFTFQAIRAYETQLVFKYLRSRADVDEVGVGLLGHSGGSSSSNLVIRLDPRFAAYASDNESQYVNVIDYGKDQRWIDETAPEVWPYHIQVNELEDAWVPSLSVEYGFEDPAEFQRILDHFNSRI